MARRREPSDASAAASLVRAAEPEVVRGSDGLGADFASVAAGLAVPMPGASGPSTSVALASMVA